jgi:hypothetical protein
MFLTVQLVEPPEKIMRKSKQPKVLSDTPHRRGNRIKKNLLPSSRPKVQNPRHIKVTEGLH